MVKSKEPIRLRRRVLKTGNTSLYLDIYMDGKRSYEYLNLYLVPEKSRADRERNRETLRMADAVRARRVVDFQNPSCKKGAFSIISGSRVSAGGRMRGAAPAGGAGKAP